MEFSAVIGLVAEYNPFHRGHARQLAEARKQLGPVPVMAVMSGSLTQRGQLPLWDKWQRTHLALLGGVDLVLELPVTGSLQSAQGFASFGVEALAAAGLVTHLSFGCEAKDPSLLLSLSQETFSPDDWQNALAGGSSYTNAAASLAAARNQAYRELFTGSNNLLALEYLKALRAHPEIQPLPIHREGQAYGESQLQRDPFPSASALRQEIRTRGCTASFLEGIPAALRPLCQAWYEETGLPRREASLDLLLSAALEKASPGLLARWTQVSEGLEDRIWKHRRSGSFAALVEACSTRRYPPSRLRRILWQLLLSSPGLSFREAAAQPPSYLRVLGFTETGRQLLRAMKGTARLPLLTALRKNTLAQAPTPAFRQQLELDLRAQNLYQLLTEGRITDKDYRMQPVREK
ncbi:nucleotidyltransferase family protein [uncultured Acidaminococcus sp.]|uniref:tRNA(Met) cytidine acetate ligase n=1 Tax=uncultured Acidaminococcus sp. TaxID=352152 RepID=UPI00262FF8E0|nr:nucleotidyltransferase family protein [uncultured Acidaminococcus sp.]